MFVYQRIANIWRFGLIVPFWSLKQYYLSLRIESYKDCVNIVADDNVEKCEACTCVVNAFYCLRHFTLSLLSDREKEGLCLMKRQT